MSFESRLNGKSKSYKKNILNEKCSYCSSRINSITNYIGINGNLIHICSNCKPQAERQALNKV